MFTFKPPAKNGGPKKNDDGPGLWGQSAKNQPASNKHIESVLGPGVNYRGTLSGNGGIRIEGTFDGEINLRGPLVIGENAKITANIRAAAVIVGGHVKGNITANKVEILSTGRVWGDLITSAFASEEGAFLRGQVRMEETALPPEQPEPTPVLNLPKTTPLSPAAAAPALIEIKPPQLQPQLQPEFKRAGL